MELVDANYKFFYIDVGCNRRISDGGVFRNCHLSKAIEQNSLNIPSVSELPNDGRKLPYVIVGDDAFPLKNYLIKPYPHQHLSREKRIFNYRLSRAQRVVENTFAILANRFRVFLTTSNLKAGFQHADFSASADFYACADFSAYPHMNLHHNADC